MATSTSTTEKKEVFVEKNPWKDMVNVFIPKTNESDEDYQFVCVNDHTYQILKNTDVAVPRPVAAILRQRSRAIRTSEIVQKRLQEQFDENNKK